MVPAKEKDHQNVSMEVLPIKEQTLPNKPRQIGFYSKAMAGGLVYIDQRG